MNKIISFFLFSMLFGTQLFAQHYNEIIAQHRADYKADFVKDANAPLKENDLKNLHFFEADSTFNLIADVVVLKDQKTFKMPTYDGTSKEFIRYAKINFILKGKPYQLTLYRNLALLTNPLYKDLLFLPFTDLTNGKTTYGGGRYIDVSIHTIQEAKINIDFNKAYNPYCAYSDGYRCPIPPEENNLETYILAGEKLYTGEKKHR